MPKKGEFKKGATEDSIRQRKYNSQPEQKKRRAERNASRAIMEKKGKVRKGDGKDVDHKNHNTADQRASNLSVKDKGENRAMNRKSRRKTSK
jgi:hypothetical protein